MGANWKTTVSGIGAALFTALTFLAALPYSFGELANILPPPWKGRITVLCLIAATILKTWNSIQQKSKEVTGGSVQQDLSGAPVINEDKATLVMATAKATPLENRP